MIIINLTELKAKLLLKAIDKQVQENKAQIDSLLNFYKVYAVITGVYSKDIRDKIDNIIIENSEYSFIKKAIENALEEVKKCE